VSPRTDSIRSLQLLARPMVAGTNALRKEKKKEKKGGKFF
jgi:hypothetical protein